MSYSRYKFLACAMLGLYLFLSSLAPIRSQSDSCSLTAILSSFEAAGISNSIDTWLSSYEASDCVDSVKSGVLDLAQGFDEITNSDNQPTGLPETWRGFLVGNGNFYIRQDFEFFPSNRLSGTTRWSYYDSRVSPNYTNSYLIEGEYYTSVEAVPNLQLWSVIDGWDSNEVTAWLMWHGTRNVEGSAILNILWVAVIQQDSTMKAAVYSEQNGGEKNYDAFYWMEANP